MPPATRRAVRGATNLLTATPDEAALIVAAALADPEDLLRLARACRRFAIKCIAAPAAHCCQRRRHSSSSDTAGGDVVDRRGGGAPMDRQLHRPGARLGAAPRS
jgi:hypothetical protein